MKSSIMDKKQNKKRGDGHLMAVIVVIALVVTMGSKFFVGTGKEDDASVRANIESSALKTTEIMNSLNTQIDTMVNGAKNEG